MAGKPWLTDGANDFLDKYITKDMVVLEFGMGKSTLWFAERVKLLVSIEHNKQWYLKAQSSLLNNTNVELILHETTVVEPLSDLIKSCYSVEIDKLQDETFDFVLIDGRNRVNCFKKADRVLKTGGYIMLDDSQRCYYSEIHDFYKDKEYTEYGLPDKMTSCWRK